MKTQRSKKQSTAPANVSGRVRGENVGRERAELAPAVRTPCCVSLDQDRGLPESRQHLLISEPTLTHPARIIQGCSAPLLKRITPDKRLTNATHL